MMEGHKKPAYGGIDPDWMTTGGICFSCDQIFANRKFLEEHVCPSASHICSCGTEFAEYDDMLQHSSTHEPGHQVLDHGTIWKRRNEKRREEDEKLKRLHSGEVVWKVPEADNDASINMPARPTLQDNDPSISLPGRPTLPGIMAPTFMSQNIRQSALTKQVPTVFPSKGTHIVQNPPQSDKDLQKIFAGVGAPTVDLWTIYQPVVLLRTMRTFNKTKPYTCGRCGESFMSRTSLVSHHSLHVPDKVSGCIGCGLLLSSRKVVPRSHVCNSTSQASKHKLITAKPLNKGKQMGMANSILNPVAKSLHMNSSLQMKGRNPRADGITSQMLMNSALQLKKTHSSHRPQLQASSLQLKNQNSRDPKAHATMLQLLKSQQQIASNKPRGLLPNSPPAQYRISTSAPLGSSMQSSAASNAFTCRVCYISFESTHLLQRHKCPKAREFMAKHTRPGRQVVRHSMMTAMANRDLSRMNGVGKLGFPVSGNMKKTQLAAGLDKGQSSAPLEDDCYIIEDVPSKPTEMIYQVTSSVPIIT